MHIYIVYYSFVIFEISVCKVDIYGGCTYERDTETDQTSVSVLDIMNDFTYHATLENINTTLVDGITNHSRCKSTQHGKEYMGTISHTYLGYTCQRWSQQNPHKHTIGASGEDFPDKNIIRAHNYCRYPVTSTNTTLGPWCYTVYKNVRWQYCMIPVCSEPAPGTYPECKNDRFGREYQGKMNYTWKNNVCLPWKLFMHPSIPFSDRNIDEALNYCRTPLIVPFDGPYCFVNYNGKPQLERCGVPICGVSKQRNEKYLSAKSTPTYKNMVWRVADSLSLFILPLVILVGTILNMLSIRTLRHPSISKTTTAFLLVSLALADTLSLYTYTFKHCLESFIHTFTKVSNTYINCKVYNYASYAIRSASGWILVIVTLERCIMMAKPHHASFICTKKNAGIVLLVVFSCICVLSIPLEWYSSVQYKIVFDENNTKFDIYIFCTFRKTYDIWFDIFVRSIVPFALMFCGNLIIIGFLYRLLQSRKKLIKNKNTHCWVDQLIFLAVLLLSASLTFLVLNLPFIVFMIIQAMFQQFIRSQYDTHDEYISSNYLFLICSVLLESVNNSFNFFIYCISGKHFRNKFLDVMAWSRLCCFSKQHVRNDNMKLVTPQACEHGVGKTNTISL